VVGVATMGTVETMVPVPVAREAGGNRLQSWHTYIPREHWHFFFDAITSAYENLCYFYLLCFFHFFPFFLRFSFVYCFIWLDAP